MVNVASKTRQLVSIALQQEANATLVTSYIYSPQSSLEQGSIFTSLSSQPAGKCTHHADVAVKDCLAIDIRLLDHCKDTLVPESDGQTTLPLHKPSLSSEHHHLACRSHYHTATIYVFPDGEFVQELTPDQVVALVSCTVWQERAEAGQKVREDMQGPFAALTQAARTVGKVNIPSSKHVSLDCASSCV